MSFTEYTVKVSKYLKKHYSIKMDFNDTETREICKTGFQLGSFPYYCADQIAEL